MRMPLRDEDLRKATRLKGKFAVPAIKGKVVEFSNLKSSKPSVRRRERRRLKFSIDFSMSNEKDLGTGGLKVSEFWKALEDMEFVKEVRSLKENQVDVEILDKFSVRGFLEAFESLEFVARVKGIRRL